MKGRSILLSLHNLSKSFGTHTIFKHISFNINPGQRVALIGENGTGKSTLLKIIVDELKADEGSFHFSPKELRVGYLPQAIQFSNRLTVSEYLATHARSLTALEKEIESLSEAIATTPDDPKLIQLYDQTLQSYMTAIEFATEDQQILDRLAIEEIPADHLVENLSGGQKTRLALASLLLQHPEFLILDEPTNHIDQELLNWFEEWILDFEGGVLMVSHDRVLLDQIATHVIEMKEDGDLVEPFAGNYSEYIEYCILKEEQQAFAYKEQQKEIQSLGFAMNRLKGQTVKKKGGKGDSGDKFAKGFFNDQTSGKMREVRSLERRLNKLLNEDHVDKPSKGWQIDLQFSEKPQSGDIVMRMIGLEVGYDGVALLDPLSLQIQFGQRITLVGPNGSGKSTILKTILGQVAPVSGEFYVGQAVKIGYLAQEQEVLNPELSVIDTIQNNSDLNHTDARTFLHKYLFAGDTVFKQVKMLSYGERARLMLALMVLDDCNFLILDEPLNHLDLPSRSRFEQALASFEGTIFAVIHDRYFIEQFAEIIWRIEGRSIRVEYPKLD